MSHLIPLGATGVAPNGLKNLKRSEVPPECFGFWNFTLGATVSHLKVILGATLMTIRCDNVAPNVKFQNQKYSEGISDRFKFLNPLGATNVASNGIRCDKCRI